MEIKVLRLKNGESLLVEVLDIELPHEIKSKLSKKPKIYDLPDGAEIIGIIDDAKISMELLKDDLRNIATSIRDAFNENSPDKFSIELKFGFAGESAIPFIVSAEANCAIKIKATWKKGS